MDDSRSIPPFRCNQIESNKLAKEWRIWKSSLECYFEAYGITDQKAMRAKLLHLGGPALQTVFKNLKDHDHVPIVALMPKYYDVAIAKLDEFFQPRHQSTSERRKLRQLKQRTGERFADFIIRLRQQVTECGFEKYGIEVAQILSEIYLTDAVVEGCLSTDVRRRILLKDLPFSEIEALGISQEGVEQQMEAITSNQLPEKVYRVTRDHSDSRSEHKHDGGNSKKIRDSFRSQVERKSCFNCGRSGHVSTAWSCPARGKQCHKCKSYGHFEKLCRKIRQESKQHTRKQVRVVEEVISPDDSKQSGCEATSEETGQEKAYYAFYSGNESNVIDCSVGGVTVNMMVDSGADANLISATEWTRLKDERIQVIFSAKGSTRVLRAYGSNKPLPITGSFIADISINGKQVRAEFLVVEGGQRCLLGDKTAKELGVLKVGLNANNVNDAVRPFTKITDVKTRIHIDPSVVPVFQPMRRIPIPLEEAVGRKLDELLARDIIEPKLGPTTWVSPLVVVGKANGEPRLCLDLRRVNEAILREHHPMPMVDDYIARLGRGKIWSKLDIREAFLQVELAEESRDTTTFITNRGLFRFKRLPFGLVTAPETFQKVMDEILSGCTGAYWYLDDIIIEGENLEQHDERLEEVLSRLKNRKVELNWGKCVFRVSQLEFLGHKITPNGISPSDTKVQAILSFREPRNEGELRSFLGLANYMNKFIPNLATIDEPLRKLLIKEVKFDWSPAQANAFNQIKQAISNVKKLGFYRVEDRTAVISDASPVGLGALLVQFDSNGVHRVVSFASKSLTETERRYCQTEKEALGIVWSVERFRYYLLGKHFEIYTDCKALSFLFSKRSKPCARIERWVLRLQSFEYKVVFMSGKENVADSLSRLAVQEPKPFDPTEEIFVREIVGYAAKSSALKWTDIERASKSDPEIQEIIRNLNNNEIHNLPIEFRLVANELCEIEGVLLRGDRIVIPKSLRDSVLAAAHDGHPGISMMKNHLRSNVWWPKLDSDVEVLVKKCRGCTLVAAPEKPEPLKRSQLPSTPWQVLALDFLGPLPEGQYLLVVIDCYSRFMEVCEMTSITAGDVRRELAIMFGRYGLPTSIKADNAPQLSSDCEEFRVYCEEHGITIMNTIPYWPQSNGQVERQNRSILKRLRIAQELGLDWRSELRQYLLTYHSTKHPTTGKSPGEIMFGRRIKSKIPTLENYQEDDSIRERDAVVKEKGKIYSDRKRQAKESEIQEGDKVLAKRMRKANKLETDFANEEFIIIKKTGTDTIIQSTVTGKQFRRSSAHLKKIYDQGEQSSSKRSEERSDNEPFEMSRPQVELDSSPDDELLTSTTKDPETLQSKRLRKQPTKYRDYIEH